MRDHDRDRDFGRELGGEMKGLGQQVKGKVKEETGDLLDDHSMEIEGKAEKNLGKVRREINQPSDVVSRDRDWSEGSDVSDRDFDRDTGIDDRDRSRGTGSDRDSSGGKGRSGY
jgi:uncharacterized protein YjbJ (UPF0337 family)